MSLQHNTYTDVSKEVREIVTRGVWCQTAHVQSSRPFRHAGVGWKAILVGTPGT